LDLKEVEEMKILDVKGLVGDISSQTLFSFTFKRRRANTHPRKTSLKTT